MTLYTDSGKEVVLGTKIGGGGEGDVYHTTSHPTQVCKVFKTDPTGTSTERRIPTMLARRPATTSLGPNREPQLCWPTGAVRHGDGRLAGFLMPLIDVDRSTVIHRISNPTDLPDTTHMRTAGFRQWRYLVRAAANLATAVSGLHPDIVIGDFNANNILVSEQTWITLIDCDSMQLTDPRGGETFYCKTRRPEYLAPELTGLDLTRHRREPASDNFALAIHIHQLLLHGFHPFSGKWVGPGEDPGQAERIRQGIWYHESVKLAPPRSAPDTAAVLPHEIISMFHDAFVTGATDPRQRPSARRWHDALATLANSLVKCRVDPEHWYPRKKRACPWCPPTTTRLPLGGPAIARSPTAQTTVPTTLTNPLAVPSHKKPLQILLALGVVLIVVLVTGIVLHASPSTPSNATGVETGGPASLPTTPTTPTTTLAPPRAVMGVVDYRAVAGDRRARAVASLLSRYYAAINDHDYDTMLALYDPAGQNDPNDSSAAEALSEGVSTSHDDDAVVRSITTDDTQGGVDVTVTMRSQQSPGYGPAEAPDETCDHWTLHYVLTGSPTAGYRIWSGRSGHPSTC